jgi:uncharacterized protein YecE (DUF72 family)
MNSDVKIGTCGFGMTKEKYALQFSTVEVQQTFYQPPMTKTLEKWRTLVPENFEFTIKAWQLITHEAKSPTFRRLTCPLSDEEKANAGYFKPTAIVEEAWKITKDAAAALGARTILFQCPASFKQTVENIKNLEKFFASVSRDDLNFVWEPRGDWNPGTIKQLCRELNLIHAVDPFVKRSETPATPYYRLHGRTGFRYKYEEEELTELAALLSEDHPAYVFFNNRYMADDAAVFKELVIQKINFRESFI